jgi:hypothetical protein
MYIARHVHNIDIFFTVKMSNNIFFNLLELRGIQSTPMDRSQLNIRVSDQLGQLIDAKRIELSKTMRSIPSRSEVIRLALEQYLEADLSDSEIDRRKTKTPKASPE